MRARALIPLIIFAAAVSMAGWSPQQLSWLRVAHERVGPDVLTPELLNGLQAYYALEDDAANTHVEDSHTNDVHGTANKNTDLLNTAGKIGKAFDFDGSADFVKTAVPVITNNFPVTITAWFKADAITAEDIVSFGDDASNNPFYRLGVRDFDAGDGLGKIKRIMFYVRDGNTSVQRAIYSKTVVATGKWYHVAVTMEAAKTQRIWIDGEEVDISINIDTGTMPATYPYTHVAIGALHRIGPSNYFDGIIDEVAIYSRALSDAEIKQHFNNDQGRTYP